MLVDLAHASERTIEDVLALATRPVVVSHTGLRGACDNNRNLRDDHVRRIAAAGGVIGIGFWSTAVCGGSTRDIARSIRYASGLVGVDHVALGSDFDGATTTPFDAAELVRLTDALLAEGFSEDDISKIMGENVIRLLVGSKVGQASRPASRPVPLRSASLPEQFDSGLAASRAKKHHGREP